MSSYPLILLVRIYNDPEESYVSWISEPQIDKRIFPRWRVRKVKN
jgi:hypothetical protein